LLFTGTGNRITGDFSNATLANRVTFQTSTVDGNTVVTAMPNGAGTGANFQLRSYDSGLGSNGNFAQIVLNEAVGIFSITTQAVGTGTALPMSFSVNASERMRIGTSGNVGIGTSSPTGRLAVAESTTGQAYEVNSSDGNRAGYIGTSNEATTSNKLVINASRGTGALVLQTVSTERMRIHAGGNVTIGATTDTGARLSVYAPANTGSLHLESDSSLGPGGQITMANTGRGAKYVRVDSSNEWQIVNDAYTAVIFRLTNAGAAFKGDNTTTWSTVSDIRIKENIRPIANALDKICALNPCYFEYKTRLGETATGFIAQEYEQVLPEHVFESLPGMEFSSIVPADEKIKGINPDLVPYLVKAIQEQQAIIESLKTRIETLEAQA
jgi:hypothetical protein